MVTISLEARWFGCKMTVNLSFLSISSFSCSFNRVILFQACDSSPCLNGGTCIQDESGEGYICKCTSGWKGGNCELDFTGTL